MNNQKIWGDFWESVNYGEQGDVEGLVWQKPDGKWVMLVADPQKVGRVFTIGGIAFNPFTGEELPTKVIAKSLTT